MTVKEVENAILDYCKKENISVVNGFIDPKYLGQVEMFLDVLKISRKARAQFVRLEPKRVGEILKNMQIRMDIKERK